MSCQSEPNANPMSLNLKPGQILQSSIYQPAQPSHFPLEFTQGAFPPNHDIRPTRRPVEQTIAEYDTVATRSPLRRNQTVSVPSSVRGTPEQSYHASHPVASEAQEYQHPYHPDVRRPNPPPSFPDTSQHTRPPLQIAPVASISPPETPPTPDLDQRFMRTLYLANPDEAPGTHDHRPVEPRLPPASETIHPSTGRRSERSSRTHHDGFYGSQPSLGATRAYTDSEGRSRSPRSTPPGKATASDNDSPRRFEPPSQTVAAMSAQYVGQAPSASSSSSRTSSNLAPRHVPKRLVMPSPLSSATESAPPSAPPTVPSAAASSRLSDGRSGQLLRKRASSAAMLPRPQRSQTLPPQTVNRGVFSLFKFGKGSKPTVREVRVTEPPKAGMQQLRVPTREEPRNRKLSKRK